MAKKPVNNPVNTNPVVKEEESMEESVETVKIVTTKGRRMVQLPEGMPSYKQARAIFRRAEKYGIELENCDILPIDEERAAATRELWGPDFKPKGKKGDRVAEWFALAREFHEAGLSRDGCDVVFGKRIASTFAKSLPQQLVIGQVKVAEKPSGSWKTLGKESQQAQTERLPQVANNMVGVIEALVKSGASPELIAQVIHSMK